MNPSAGNPSCTFLETSQYSENWNNPFWNHQHLSIDLLVLPRGYHSPKAWEDANCQRYPRTCLCICASPQQEMHSCNSCLHPNGCMMHEVSHLGHGGTWEVPSAGTLLCRGARRRLHPKLKWQKKGSQIILAKGLITSCHNQLVFAQGYSRDPRCKWQRTHRSVQALS